MKPNWKDILINYTYGIHNWHTFWQDVKKLEYPYFMWNDKIYDTKTGYDTDWIKDDIDNHYIPYDGSDCDKKDLVKVLFWVDSSGMTKRDEQIVYFSKDIIKDDIKEDFLIPWVEEVYTMFHFTNKSVTYGYEIIKEEQNG